MRAGANRHDLRPLAALLDALLLDAPPEAARCARHRGLDRGDDDDACREAATARGDTPPIPPKASAAQPLPPPGHPDRHPPRRGVVAVAHRWCNRCRRLLVRGEKQAKNALAFVHLAAILIIYRKLRHARTPFG